MTQVIYWNTFCPESLDTNRFWPARLDICTRVIRTLKPDIFIWLDAFSSYNLSDDLYSNFPEYTPYTFNLQDEGDEGIKQFYYCVLVRNTYSKAKLVRIETLDIGNTRYAVKITVNEIKILAAHLEYNSKKIREIQLEKILRSDVDIICGLNIIFCDVRREYFGNIVRIFRNWKKIGLFLIQPTVRQTHTPRSILNKYGWEVNSENRESYPLKFFMNLFLKSNTLLRMSERIWKIIFNKPVLPLDNVLITIIKNLYIHSSILIGGDIKEVSGHAIVQIHINSNP